jgi:hypothetical protein
MPGAINVMASLVSGPLGSSAMRGSKRSRSSIALLVVGAIQKIQFKGHFSHPSAAGAVGRHREGVRGASPTEATT